MVGRVTAQGSISRCGAARAERPDAAGLSGGAIGVGRHGVEERADKQGPCISEGRERRHRE
jgi:hypothetical protein